jgi:hypothetical protein
MRKNFKKSSPPYKDELERLILAHSPKFQRILNTGMKQIRETGGIGHEDFWRRVETENLFRVSWPKPSLPTL